MTRWTNGLSWWFQVPHFFEGDRKHLQDYIDGKSESFYHKEGVNDILAPDGYGIVVVDCINKQIISCQGYTSLQTIHFSSVALSNTRLSSPDEDPRCEVSNALLEFNRLGWLRMAQRVKDQYVEVAIPDNVDLIDMCEEAVKDNLGMFRKMFVVDVPDWTITHLHDDLEGFLKAKTLIGDLFELTAKEEAAWDEYLKYYYEDEED